MVAISMSGSGEGPGWVTAPGYSTAGLPTCDNHETVESRGKMGKTRGLPYIVAEALEALRPQ